MLSNQRWSSRDPESLMGANGAPDSAESWQFALLAGGLGVVALRRLLPRVRPEVILEVTVSGIRIGKTRSPRFIAWEDVAEIESDLGNPRARPAPRVRIRLNSSEIVSVPSQLYPEAESDFPTRAHLDRARNVADSLVQAFAAHGDAKA